MAPIIRPGRPDDLDDIAEFATDTFEWGDYVARAYPHWLEDEDGVVMVAEVDGRVRSLARVFMAGSTEAWSQGMRTHPDHRRRGLGRAVGAAMWSWAAERGARVVRLLTEHWNHEAASMVAAQGFRPVARWIVAERGIGENSPVVEGNGGRRVPPPERLNRAPRGESHAAIMAWSAGGLEQASHGLNSFDWTWRRLGLDDVSAAAARGTLWSGRPGWAIAEVEEVTLFVSWVVTTPGDADAMALALVDVASRSGVEVLDVRCPQVDWLESSLRRHGCEIYPMVVHAKAL